MSLYKDPVLAKIFENIAGANSDIQSYHYGDPLFLPKSELPALIGQLDNTEVSDLSNAEDQHRLNYVLTLVTDIREFFGETNPDNIHVGYQLAQKIIEERGANYELASTSLLDIIRNNAELGNNAHIDTTNVTLAEYGFTLGKRGENNWAWEANIQLSVYFSQLR